jgi:hypothetical protein
MEEAATRFRLSARNDKLRAALVMTCRGRLDSHAGGWTKPPGAEVDAERIQGSAVGSARMGPVDETPGLDSATGGFVDGEG